MRDVSPTRALLLFSVLVSLSGCGDRQNVGGACAAPALGCDDGLVCDATVEGGYCTAACTVAGSGAECPEASVCDDVSGAGALSCARICRDQGDCRADLECSTSTSSSVKTCRVKT